MKVKTVGLLSLCGMLLSSVTVWSLTKERKLTPTAAQDGSQQIAADLGPEPSQSQGAIFTAGRAIMLEGRLGHATLSADRPGENFLLLTATAERDVSTASSTPLNLSIVIDRSGSMKGRRLNNAADAARGMLGRLRDGDVVSLVTYNTTTEVVVPSTTIDSFSRDRVQRALSQITASGDTCISCGIDAGMEQLRRRSDMTSRILLLSDGEATTGIRSVEEFRRLASRVRDLGASISAIGVDVQYNERVMSALALESNGRHHFVENASQLPAVFDTEFASLVKTLAKDSEVSVELAPGVRVRQVFDRSFRQEGNRLIVPFGTFSAGEEKTLLVKLDVDRGAAGTRPVADVRMTYDDFGAGGRGSCEGKLSVDLVEGDALAALDPVVQTRLLRSQTVGALNEANRLFTSGRRDEAQRKLKASLDDLNRQRVAAIAAAPAPKRAKLEQDFKGQSAALGEASDGFAAPPSAEPGSASAPRPAAQVRRNASTAVDMAF
ncbi:MAG: VWA domain-containing protein [Polyangiaceae bacterium]